MDLSRLNPTRVLIGAAGSALLILSILLLPWFSLSASGQRANDPEQNFICGHGELDCTGFDTFPILRWLLLAAALAPPILAYILLRGHKLSWAPGEMTMVAGFAAAVLIFYNGIIDRPGSTFGVSLEIGYWLALVAALVIAATGFTRSVESGGRQGRKAPGTV